MGNIHIQYCAWWIPRSFMGVLHRTMSTYKAAYMALKMVLLPPQPRPKVIVLDTSAIALFLLNALSNYSTFFVDHFEALKDIKSYTSYIKITPSLFSAMWMKHANEIIVQTECISSIFRRSYPNIRKDVKIFVPSVDTGIWAEDCIDLNRIIPDLPKNYFLFCVFGRYCKKSNFRLAINSFEQLIMIAEEECKPRVHLVFAGHAKTLDEKVYYNEIIELIKEKPFANQVTFLRRLPVVHKKTIIAKSTAVLYTAKYDVFPGPITLAMCLGTPVIATNTGIALKMISHRISGILVDPAPLKFASAMYKIITKPTLHEFIKDMAMDVYKSNYSFETFSRRLHQLVMKYEGEDEKQIKF